MSKIYSKAEIISNQIVADVLSTLFLFFNIIIYLSLSLYGLEVNTKFLIFGMLGILTISFIVSFFSHTKTTFSVYVFIGVVFLSLLSFLFIKTYSITYFKSLELYLISLICIPVLFNVWQWHFQLLSVLIIFISAVCQFIRFNVHLDFSFIFVLALIGALSILLNFFRNAERIEKKRLIEGEGIYLLNRLLSVERGNYYLWTVLLLEAAIVSVFLFFDFCFWSVESFYSIIPKAYSLTVIAIGGFVLRLVSKKYHSIVVALVTCIVAGSFSLARLGYANWEAYLMTVPIICLFYLIAFIPWKFVYQLGLIWVILLLDFTAASFFILLYADNSMKVSDKLVVDYSLQSCLISTAAIISVFLARWLSVSRARNIASWRSLSSSETEYGSGINKHDEIRSYKIGESASASFNDLQYKDNSYRFCVAFIFLAIVSLFFTSMTIFSSSKHGVNSIWFISFIYLLAIIFLWIFRNNSYFSSFKTLAVVLTSLSFLSTIGFIVAFRMKDFWLYLPLGMLAIIGFVPWPLYSLIGLFILFSVCFAEIYQALSLGLTEVLLMSLYGCLSLLLSLRTSRLSREASLLKSFISELSECEDFLLLKRMSARYFSALLGSPWSFVFAEDEENELVSGNKAFVLPNTKLMLRTPDVEWGASDLSLSKGVDIASVSNLPEDWKFFDSQIGLCCVTNGIMICIESLFKDGIKDSTEKRTDPKVDRFVVFVGFYLPFVRMINKSAISLLAQMAAVSQIRLEYLAKQRAEQTYIDLYEEKIEQKDRELGSLVYEANDTVQDIVLSCDELVKANIEENDSQGSKYILESTVEHKLNRIIVLSRSIAALLSDVKRRIDIEAIETISHKENVEVSGIIREVVSQAVVRAERKDILLESSIMPEGGLWTSILGPEYLESILRNLLNNAIHYSNPGYSVQLRLSYDSNSIWIDVNDFGTGLSDEEKSLIFKKEYRKKGRGLFRDHMGFGLYQSSRVLEAAGGSLTVESIGQGKGCKFSVVLPRIQAVSNISKNNNWALIVEDQRVIAHLYKSAVEEIHVEAVMAHSLSDARELVANRGQPSFVLSDVDLGDGSGLDLVKELRVQYGDVFPIIVISGLVENSVIKEAQTVGVSEFLTKPVNRTFLINKLRALNL